jgi:hypothetical protein
MQVISEGFTVKVEVNKIESIKPSQGGNFNGNAYGPSANFRTTKSYQVEDDELGVIEKEEVLDIKVRCETTKEAIQICELLRKHRAEGTPVYVNGNIPRSGQRSSDPFSMVSTDTPAEFLKNNGVKTVAK